MKKIICLMLAVILISSLSACTKTISGPVRNTDETTVSDATTAKTENPENILNDKSAFEIVLDAINKTTDLSSFSATMNSYASIEYLNVKENTNVKAKINAQNVNTSSLRFSAAAEYTEGAEKINTNIYFENNNYYVDSYGLKAKIPASRGGDAYDYFGEIDKYFLPLSESCYDSASVTDLNGGKSVIINVSAEDCEKDFEDIIEETVSSFEQSGLGKLTFAGAYVRATTNGQGYIDVYTVSLNFDWDVQIGVMYANGDIDMVWSIDFDEYGNVSVTAPEDYASYTEIAADEMAYALLAQRVEFMKSLDDISADCDMTVQMQVGGNKETFNILNLVRAKNLSSNPSVYHNTCISSSVLSEESSIYYENGYYYYFDDNESLKFSEDIAKGDYRSLSPTFDIVKELSVEAMKNSSVMVVDGITNIMVALDGELFAEEFSVIVEELNYSIAGVGVSEYSIYAPYVTVEIDGNGYIISYEVVYGVEIPLGNDEFVYSSIEVRVTFNNIGEDVEIVLPNGYWNFQEIYTDVLS